MPIAAHRCTIRYISGGFAAGGQTLQLVSGTTYAISGTFKNVVLNPDVAAPTVYDGGVSIGTAFTVNHLAGQVTLNAPPTGAVTMDFGYLNLNTALEVREFSFNISRDELEATVIGDTAKEYIMGLKSGSGTISGLDVLSTLYLNFAGPPTIQHSIQSVFDNETRFVFGALLNPDTNRYFRAFVKIPSLDLSGARDGLVEGSFPFTISEVVNSKEVTGKASATFFTGI